VPGMEELSYYYFWEALAAQYEYEEFARSE
jgi:hypothetical protein